MSVERINDRWAQTHGDDRHNYRARYIAINQPRRSLWHWMLGCKGLVESDAHGLWFQCSTCGWVTGFVPRDTLDHQLDWHLGVSSPRSVQEPRP